MKTKSILISIFALLFAQAIYAGGPIKNPTWYSERIEDSYRFQMASAKYCVVHGIRYGLISAIFGVDLGDESLVRSFEILEQRANKIFDDTWLEFYPYRRALQEFSSTSELAATVLDYYYAVPAPRFSEFIELREEAGYKVWTATEYNSGMQITFMISSKMFNYDYELSFDANDAFWYALSFDVPQRSQPQYNDYSDYSDYTDYSNNSSYSEPQYTQSYYSEDYSGDNGYMSILSQRKLTYNDVSGKSAYELSIMRNSIYAKYCYRFKRQDLLDYFNQFDWYYPSTSDAQAAYNQMSEIERYNVNFIKRYE